ncbi:TPA: hypothetical protein U5D93_003467 [Yersinia enterocolitica]|nr:hypothetical protein [Yersinia enterocolitica]HDL8420899.1 hypothetical protein [Yersinia enterocolitica]HDW7095319.1 hypothetical protein [Yersinia enterocolitica]HEN3302886.1 hypothetical protein [Yersinia enterocolitica]HEN3393346.1 hypothetical protein [Yersinia enterocolitica]
MDKSRLAYVDEKGDLIVKDVYETDTSVPLMRVKAAEDIVYQLWRLSTKNNYESEALKQAIEIMAKKNGLMNPAGDWTYVGNG